MRETHYLLIGWDESKHEKGDEFQEARPGCTGTIRRMTTLLYPGTDSTT